MRTKPSVICTNCTPLNTASSGSTPGFNRGRKGKNQKNTVHMHHSCTLSGRKHPETLIRQHLFPLSITDGEGWGEAARRDKCNNCDKLAWKDTKGFVRQPGIETQLVVML